MKLNTQRIAILRRSKSEVNIIWILYFVSYNNKKKILFKINR